MVVDFELLLIMVMIVVCFVCLRNGSVLCVVWVVLWLLFYVMNICLLIDGNFLVYG